LDEARTRYAAPVLGLGHAALHTATALFGPVSLVTVAGASAALARALIARYGLAAAVPRVIEISGRLQDLGPTGTTPIQVVEQAIVEAVRHGGIRAVLLGGAFFAGLAPAIRAPVPVFDSIALAVGCASLCLRVPSPTT
jgi:allantoin racemase